MELSELVCNVYFFFFKVPVKCDILYYFILERMFCFWFDILATHHVFFSGLGEMWLLTSYRFSVQFC